MHDLNNTTNFTSVNDTEMDSICGSTSTDDITQMEEILQFLVYGILLNAVGLVGLAGNIISITILSRPNMRSSINCCLVGLASFDTILLITSVLMFGLPAIPEYTGSMMWYQKNVFPWVTLATYPFGLIAQTGSVYLTVTVTMERYVAVCHPLKARSICTYGRAKLYVIAAALFSLLYNLPKFWEVTYKYCEFDDTVFAVVEMSEMRSNLVYIKVYITWMYLFVMYLIPFLSLLVFNVFIYKQIRELNQFAMKIRSKNSLNEEVRLANHEIQRLSRLQRKELGLAVMLLFVVVVFFFCNILAFVVSVLEVAGIKYHLLTVFSNFLVTVNSSVNFIIYCIFGQKFRKLFLQLFCCGIFRSYAPADIPDGGNSMYGDRNTIDSRYPLTQSVRLSSWSGSHANRVLQSQNNGTWQGSRSKMPLLTNHIKYNNAQSDTKFGRNGSTYEKGELTSLSHSIDEKESKLDYQL